MIDKGLSLESKGVFVVVTHVVCDNARVTLKQAHSHESMAVTDTCEAVWTLFKVMTSPGARNTPR